MQDFFQLLNAVSIFKIHPLDLRIYQLVHCSLEIIILPFISLVTKFEVYNVFIFKLEHFVNDIHFCETFDILLP